MASLFVTLSASVTLPNGDHPRNVDKSRAALSLKDLTVLKDSLRARGKSLRQFLAEAGPLELRTVRAGQPEAVVCDELFGPLEKAHVEPPAGLVARRKFLAARQEEREYSTLVASVQQSEIAERNRESFSQFHQQASVGMNLVMTVFTATLCGYFIGRFYAPHMVWRSSVCSK